MREEIRFATFNVCNLALPGMPCYADMEIYTPEQYEAKTSWIASQIDALDADVIGFQEVFSQAALQYVLSKTRQYRNAILVGFDPDPAAACLTPSVALVSRLPLACEPVTHALFPRSLSIPLPDCALATTSFTRSLLQVSVVVSSRLTIQVMVLHFKSKRPYFIAGEQTDDPYRHGIALLRSQIRRGAEALALRYLLIDVLSKKRMPVVVLGDFNDGAQSASTRLVMGEDNESDAAGASKSANESGAQARLFDCYRLQTPAPELNASHYSIANAGSVETIDHILVSDYFNPAYSHAVGKVAGVSYFNQHLSPQLPHTSDHAQVVARIQLFGQ